MQTTQPDTSSQATISTTSKVPLSRHPFIVPVLTFLGLFLITITAVVLLGSQTVGPTDKRLVNLYVDGEQQTVPTRAETVGELLNRLDIQTSEGDIVEPAIESPIDADNFTVNVYTSRPVVIADEASDREISIVSAHPDARDVAKEAGLTLYPEDIIKTTPPDDFFNDGLNEQIVINRATLTYVNLYGNVIEARTHATTVGELLKEKNIQVQTGDQLSPAADTKIVENSQVFVARTGTKIETKTEKIAAPVEVINDATLAIGTTKVKEEGRAGERLVTYELQLSNGKVVGRKVLQKVVSLKPQKRVELRGTKVPTVAIAGNKAEILSAAGVPASQHFAADFILAHESGWRLNAQNAGGCLGLGQACPGSKLVAACPAWQTDAICQIQFFDGYATGRYGSWSNAYQAWQIQGWW
jgi:uncharacterized protein YabE (DUF348 family)